MDQRKNIYQAEDTHIILVSLGIFMGFIDNKLNLEYHQTLILNFQAQITRLNCFCFHFIDKFILLEVHSLKSESII